MVVLPGADFSTQSRRVVVDPLDDALMSAGQLPLHPVHRKGDPRQDGAGHEIKHTPPKIKQLTCTRTGPV
jgi:hypothetical protein